MEQPIHSAYDGIDLVSETQNGLVITRATDELGRDTGFSLGSDYSVQYGYDAYGRFHSVSSSVQSASSVATYSYLEDSDLLSGMTASSGFLWSRAYESRSLITAVENSFGETVISRYDYENNDLGQRTHIERSGQAFGDLPVRDAYEYNPRSEVTSARRTPVGSQTELRGFSYDYTYDPIGNRVTSTEYDHEGNALESEYTANALNQYGQRTVPGYAGVRGEADTNATVTVNADPAWRYGEYFYGGDEADNSSDAVMKELEITATYSNLFTSVTGRVFVAETPEAFTYDDDGNLTQDGRFTYTWDGENRLIKAETRDDLPAAVPRVRVEYAYDHQGRMVWKQVSTNAVVLSTCTLLWDGYNIVQETICNQQSSITNSYVWGLDLSGTLQSAGGVGGLLAEVKDGEPYLAVFDANGNITEYISADGTLAAHYEYSPFGEIVVQSGDLADSYTHRFSTKPWCPVTGLSEYEFRKYSPGMGCWLNRDPAGERGGSNLRVVNRNDCVNRRDYLGLVSDECCFCFVDRGSVKVSRSANEGDHMLEIDTTLQFANNRENAQGMTARPRCCGYRQFAYLKYWTRGGAPIAPPHDEDAWADDNYSRSEDQDGDRGLGHPGAYFTDLPGLEGLPSETDIVFQFCFMQQVYDTCQDNVGIVWQYGPVCYQVSGTGPKRTVGKLPKESVPALPGDIPRLPTEYPTIGDLGMNLP